MIVIILGAGITRYFSYEGMMHIREGAASNVVYTNDTYLNFQAQYKGQQYDFHEPVLFASIGRNHFHKEYLIGDQTLDVRLKKVLPNPIKSLVAAEDGLPTIKIVFGSAGGRNEYFLQQGKALKMNGLFSILEKQNWQMPSISAIATIRFSFNQIVP